MAYAVKLLVKSTLAVLAFFVFGWLAAPAGAVPHDGTTNTLITYGLFTILCVLLTVCGLVGGFLIYGFFAIINMDNPNATFVGSRWFSILCYNIIAPTTGLALALAFGTATRQITTTNVIFLPAMGAIYAIAWWVPRSAETEEG